MSAGLVFRTLIISLMMVCFAGYQMACACASTGHSAQHVQVISHSMMTMDMEASASDCHETKDVSGDHHVCPRYPDLQFASGVDLSKPFQLTSVSSFAALGPPGYDVLVRAGQGGLIRAGPLIGRDGLPLTPLRLKVRFLN